MLRPRHCCRFSLLPVCIVAALYRMADASIESLVQKEAAPRSPEDHRVGLAIISITNQLTASNHYTTSNTDRDVYRRPRKHGGASGAEFTAYISALDVHSRCGFAAVCLRDGLVMNNAKYQKQN